MSNLRPAAEKQQKLTAKINDADRAYWQDGKPKMADATYDRLLAELGALEHAHPELNRTASPTQRIGGKLLSEFESVPHAAPMLSLDNIFDLKELETRLRHWSVTVQSRDGQGAVTGRSRVGHGSVMGSVMGRSRVGHMSVTSQ